MKTITMGQAHLDWLLQQEKEKQEKLLAQCFGYYLLLLSLQEKPFIPSCPIKQAILVRPEQNQYNEKGSVIANWVELPFAPDSIDLVVLSHVFERIDDTQALLKEINTVLRHDGKLLISGFNPGRLRARNLAKCYHAKAAHLKLCSTVMFILQKEGFEVKEVCHYGFFRIRNKILAKYVSKLCRLFSPGLACGYLIVAEKKVLAPIVAKPDWQKPLLEPEKVRLPTSCRVKDE